MNTPQISHWICIDLDENIHCMIVDENKFVFRDEHKEETAINVLNYKIDTIENCLNTFGLTMFQSQGKLSNIVELYTHRSKLVIAECLYKTRAYLYTSFF